MGIKVEGMDEIQKHLREIQRNSDHSAFDEWAYPAAKMQKWYAMTRNVSV